MDNMEIEHGRQLPENSMCGPCELRVNFASLFKRKTSDYPEREWTLPTLMEAARECRFCSFVLKVLSQNNTVNTKSESIVCSMTVEGFGSIQSGPYNPDTMNHVSRLRLDLKVGGEDPAFSDSDHTQPSYPAYNHHIQLLAPNTLKMSTDLMLLGRSIGRTQMDINLVLDWLSRCELDHDNCTPERWIDEPKLSLRLIDVTRRKVVKAPRNCKYIALSYVWGGIDQLQLERGTFARLTEDDGILNGNKSLPKSIMDAIALCCMLEQDYLWVDSLCIIQDDLEDKQQQIANMDVIYKCALLTIVSAAGPNANAGLPGALPGSRSVTQFTESLNGVNMITAQCPFSWALNESTWETRGWTFQEKVLSKRLLIFTKHQVFYHCNAATWFEDTILENDNSNVHLVLEEDPDEQRCHKPSLKVPAFKRYCQLLNGYFFRNLSHEGDALNAFAGLLKSLSAELGSDHFWGLPMAVFDKAMHWATILHFPNRRNLGFPSWSWSGWKGGDFAALASNTFEERDIKPVSKWYRLDEHGGHVIIQSLDFGSQDKYINNALKLSEDAEMGELQHDKAIMPPISHLLRFWTSSANLLIRAFPKYRLYRWYYNSCNCELFEVTTRNGNPIGSICLNKAWWESRTDEFEFIIISQNVFHNSNNEDSFNVMLIEWHNGVAYRVQLSDAPFPVKTWVEAGPQWKLITLG